MTEPKPTKKVIPKGAEAAMTPHASIIEDYNGEKWVWVYVGSKTQGEFITEITYELSHPFTLG